MKALILFDIVRQVPFKFPLWTVNPDGKSFLENFNK
jgi:hypothetical protein